MPLEFIDTHAHLCDEAYRTDAQGACDAEDVISRAAEAGVGTILLPDIDSKERALCRELCLAHPGTLFQMAGLYPGSVTADWEKEMDLVEAAITAETVAIGEIGLDYHWSTEFAAQQKIALRYQLEMASRLGLPVNIHLRDATEDFFEVLGECRHLGLRGNIHAYSGSYETYLRLQKYGSWKVGIGGVVTFKNAKVALSVMDIPLEDIVLETDSPYLSPVPLRGRRNEPANIPVIAAKIAEIKGISIEETAEVTTAAARELFALG